MKRSAILLALVVLVPLAGCATLMESNATPLEMIFTDISAKGWKKAYAKDVPGQGNIIERIPKDESLDNWTKMITIQFLENEHSAPREFMKGLERTMTGRCPDVTWSVIDSTSNSILYEWRIAGCQGQDDQHEVARLLRGNDGLHRFAYVEKVPELAPEVREQWIANLRSAYLVKGSTVVRPN